MNYFILAGEPSGDYHWSNLMKAIKNLNPNASFFGHGGNKMVKEGLSIVEHIDTLSIMGFTEVIKHLPKMLKIMGKTIRLIEEEKPDRIILIDYPGFNLRLAKNIHYLNIPVTYFILPQVWAWKENRIKGIKKYIDQSLCIFPFEQNWFESRGIPANYVGHPFADRHPLSITKTSYFEKAGLKEKGPVLTLLPGSRQQEVDRHWPVFLNVVKKLKQLNDSIQFIVGKGPHVLIDPCPDYIIIEPDARKAMAFGTAAITASGTATLECAVEDIPLVVCYKFSSLSWIIVKHSTKVKFASMVNLILNRKVVPEFLQGHMTTENISSAIIPLLDIKSSERRTMLDNFNEVRRSLGLPGVYDRAAKAIILKDSD